MLNETRVAAMTEVTSVLESALSKEVAVPARVGGKDCFLYRTNVVDDNGMPVFATISVTVKNNEATETCAAFDPEAAKVAYTQHQTEAAEKSSAPKKSKVDPEAAARRTARLEAVKKWIAESAQPETEYTTTDVYQAIGAEVMTNVMMCGSTLVAAAEEGLLVYRTEGKKKIYSLPEAE